MRRLGPGGLWKGGGGQRVMLLGEDGWAWVGDGLSGRMGPGWGRVIGKQGGGCPSWFFLPLSFLSFSVLSFFSLLYHFLLLLKFSFLF